MVTDRELDRRVERALRAMATCGGAARHSRRAHLSHDPELGGRFTTLLVAYKNARALAPFGLIRRDSLTD